MQSLFSCICGTPNVEPPENTQPFQFVPKPPKEVKPTRLLTVTEGVEKLMREIELTMQQHLSRGGTVQGALAIKARMLEHEIEILENVAEDLISHEAAGRGGVSKAGHVRALQSVKLAAALKSLMRNADAATAPNMAAAERSRSLSSASEVRSAGEQFLHRVEQASLDGVRAQQEELRAREEAERATAHVPVYAHGDRRLSLAFLVPREVFDAAAAAANKPRRGSD